MTLGQCLQSFTTVEKLGADETWFFSKLLFRNHYFRYCPKCKEFQPATKETSLWKVPPFLMLHLKRFRFDGQYWRKVKCILGLLLSVKRCAR